MPMIDHLPRPCDWDGETCEQCGEPVRQHRKLRQRTDTRKKSGPSGPSGPRGEKKPQPFIGIDGEGQTRDGKHVYVLLAAVNEEGERWHVENPDGLTTLQCLEFLWRLPARAKKFTYSFGYDLTKILEDVGDCALYRLFRPEERRATSGWNRNKPVFWKCTHEPPFEGWWFDYLNGRMTIKRQKSGKRVHEPYSRPEYRYDFTRRALQIYDIWKFFQGRFTMALEDWSIGSKDLLARMKRMKDLRADFDKLSPNEVREYCFEECQCMAELARRLTEAHVEAGIPLRSYFGAGSSASAMLKVMGVGAHVEESRKQNAVPEETLIPVASAFFGGRFENSVIGPVEGTVYNYDIASAYPYQLYFLPCLLHGRWVSTEKREDIFTARTALVRYRIANVSGNTSWAPFPFRDAMGCITFPSASGGGWLWKDEYLAGERLFLGVQFLEAWVYESTCVCKPFAKIPEYYRERIRIGKEGPGIVLKLGCNSCYGKIAQMLGGEGPFTSMVWAGLITSGTRAQLLDALGKHKDWSNLLMFATDGICTRERLELDRPRDTGTYDLGKPLGVWEEKTIPNGVFFARPGIYFGLNPSKEHVAYIRGRGVGRGVILEYQQKIIDAFKAGEPGVHVKNLSRFIGAKHAISRGGPPGARRYKRSPLYGTWIKRPVDMSFDPMPKRARILEDGKLELRTIPEDMTSAPYGRFMHKTDCTCETCTLKALAEEAEWSPDGGEFADYEEI
jgi:hypothetical protein